jgi:hypothetical protein
MLIIYNIREYTYWEHKGKIFVSQNKFLHESWVFTPLIILITLFCILKSFILCGELPQKHNIINRDGVHTGKIKHPQNLQNIRIIRINVTLLQADHYCFQQDLNTSIVTTQWIKFIFNLLVTQQFSNIQI